MDYDQTLSHLAYLHQTHSPILLSAYVSLHQLHTIHMTESQTSFLQLSAFVLHVFSVSQQQIHAIEDDHDDDTSSLFHAVIFPTASTPQFDAHLDHQTTDSLDSFS